MPPEETPAPEAPQAVPESPTPVIEAPAPAIEPATPPQEAMPAPTGPQGPLPFSTTDDRQENQVAQIPPNEPIPAEPEPIAPTPAPEPPSAAAPVSIGILHTARDLLAKARVSIQDRKRKKRDKIMLALTTKNKITNDEVEKLVGVSNATAERYLDELEKEGKLTQHGTIGQSVFYTAK